jgi:hypothetical protein
MQWAFDSFLYIFIYFVCSELMIAALTGSSGEIYDEATEGGKAGREGYDCDEEFPNCFE